MGSFGMWIMEIVEGSGLEWSFFGIEVKSSVIGEWRGTTKDENA